MKQFLFMSVFVSALGGFAAMPEVSAISVAQSPARDVTVSYTISGAAGFVTAVFETNYVNEAEETVWVALKAEDVKTVTGDINAKFGVGEHSFVWKARRDWPNREPGAVRVKVTAFNEYDPPDYVAIDLTQTSGGIGCYASADDIPGGIGDDVYKTTTLLLRRIHAAGVRWRMGSPKGEWGHYDNKELARMVTLSRDYYIGVYEFTQKQYELVAGYAGSTVPNANPSVWKGKATAAKRPVTNLDFTTLRGSGYGWPSSHDVDLTRCLGLLRTRTGLQFDLPTGAEWEFACRAGTTSAYYNGKNSAQSDDWPGYDHSVVADYAWEKWNTSEDDDVSEEHEVHVVGQKLPNAWNLYDMMGNACEICLDWWDVAVPAGEVIDPVGPAAESGVAYQSSRLWKGGSVDDNISGLRSASTYTWNGASHPHVGFRVCCPAVFP